MSKYKEENSQGQIMEFDSMNHVSDNQVNTTNNGDNIKQLVVERR